MDTVAPFPQRHSPISPSDSLHIVTTPDCQVPCLTIKMAIHSPYHVEVVDIRRDKFNESLLQLMLNGLKPVEAEARQLPTLILYDGIFEILHCPQQLTMRQSVV